MANEPPNFREAMCCYDCVHNDEIRHCGCCPGDNVCTLHDNCLVNDGYVCDDFESITNGK